MTKKNEVTRPQDFNDKFYRLGSKLSSSTLQFYPINISNAQVNKLQEIPNLILGNYDHVSFPVVFKYQSGKKFCDVLDTGWPGFYLISDKFKEILIDNNLKGWNTFDVILLDKKNEKIGEQYYGLSVLGRCGPINYDDCEFIKIQRVPGGPVVDYRKGYSLGLDRWDGTDFFIPEKSSGTVVTEKAARILKKNKLTNLTLRDISEIEIPEYQFNV